jgi:hypothetical protein
MYSIESELRIEVTCSSKMSVDFQWTTQHYVQEDRTLLIDACLRKGDGHLGRVLNGMAHINGGY